MPISLNQPGGPGYKIDSILSAAPLPFLSGATYSARHFSLAFTDKKNRYSHIALAALEWIPVIGGLTAVADWYLNKKITPIQSQKKEDTFCPVSKPKTFNQIPGFDSSSDREEFVNLILTACSDPKNPISKEDLQQILTIHQDEIKAFPEDLQVKLTLKLSELSDKKTKVALSSVLTHEIKTLNLGPLNKLSELRFILALEELESRNEQKNLSFSLEEIESFISEYNEAKNPEFSEEENQNIATIKSKFLPKAEIEKQAAYNLAIQKNTKANKIVQEPITVEEFKDVHYPKSYKDSPKFRSRMDAIATYFGKKIIIPVKGDGDCFFNSLIPGLLLKAKQDSEFRKTLLEKINTFSSSPLSYVKLNNTPLNSKNDDFIFVKNHLNAFHSESTSNEEFNEKFSRVLRYMCLVQNANRKNKLDEEEMPSEIGSEKAHADVEAIGLVNEIFGTKACCAVLEKTLITEQGTSDQTSSLANEVFITKGESERAYENTNCDAAIIEAKNADFILVLNQGHYSCLI